MIEFFKEKFEYDLHANRTWIQRIEAEDLTQNGEIRKLISHILNVHYIWIARLSGKTIDSADWDILPSSHWEHFAQNNFFETNDFLDQLIALDDEQIKILYHILNHSNYHRGQISLLIKQAGKTAPNANFISFH